MVTTVRRSGGSTAALVIRIVADIMAAIIGLWILLYVLDANRGNDLVVFVQDAARWLAGWSHDLFDLEPGWFQVLINYGIAAVVYLFIGHLLAARIRRY
ncbi:hypothetical protein CUT44_29920 [Streptomyces carminius]|uniref:Uncharacterized protein n=1 Tax=Streptomyces carminius TaxID=2665496 RepID=A0A2M8LR76_9ACTN|nr:hypothetical protein [Streptomyces carminius]PJE94445.1 hypothetical protein CUT44_29920 [Streptomyces carminius]